MKLKSVVFQGVQYDVGKNGPTHFAGDSTVTSITVSGGAFIVGFQNGTQLVLNGPGMGLANAADAPAAATPRKSKIQTEAAPKRKRGRPRKIEKFRS